MQREADDEERAERGFPKREGRADGQPFTEVVKADPDRDEQREDRARALCRLALSAGAPEPLADGAMTFAETQAAFGGE